MSAPGGVKSEYPPEKVASPVAYYSKFESPASVIDNLFITSDNMVEEGDVGLEWLSNFVEDCLSSTGNCILPPPTPTTTTTTATHPSLSSPLKPQQQQHSNLKTTHQDQNQNQNTTLVALDDFVRRGKSKRTKRKRPTTNPLTTWSSHHYLEQQENQTIHVTTHSTTTTTNTYASSETPLLVHQAYWLADSELIVPKKQNSNNTDSPPPHPLLPHGPHDEEMATDPHGEKMDMSSKNSLLDLDGTTSGNGLLQQPRRCTHCLSQRTPQWRAGPLGPKTLCNACGVRFKSGRLLPEYRPAKSPTFVSYKHSNSHKKVMEMRMSVSPSTIHSD